MVYEIVQRDHVIATTDTRSNAEDIVEAMTTFYPQIPFTYRRSS